MRRALAAIAAVAVLAIAALALSRGEDPYLVRAVFDTSAFTVEGGEVRVAGATVGSIDKIDVSRRGEVAGYEDDRPREIPGKAILVLKIDDPGFQDFRQDASCAIRPQSLIGEKFVDCRPTRPRAPGSEQAPPLREVAEGQPGEGQLLLPLERNSATVDPDLVNNINRLPYAQRFRLIFNELGVGLAGRGEDIQEAVKRANPVLRDATELLETLNSQRDRLAQLSSDSRQILAALARERRSVAGFFSNAGAAAEASAERGEALEASFSRLPRFLREFRSTMRELRGFSDAAAPVFSDLDRATPALTQATRALRPFAAASTVALRSLGATGEVAGPKLRAADPVVRKTRNLARSGARPTANLARFLVSTQKTGGWEALTELIYNTALSLNEFDDYGHFGRSLVTLTNCVDYVLAPESGCSANFNGPGTVSSAFDPVAFYRQIQEELEEKGGEATESGAIEAPEALGEAPEPEQSPDPSPQLGESEQLGAAAPLSRSQRVLLDYLLAP